MVWWPSSVLDWAFVLAGWVVFQHWEWPHVMWHQTWHQWNWCFHFPHCYSFPPIEAGKGDPVLDLCNILVYIWRCRMRHHPHWSWLWWGSGLRVAMTIVTCLTIGRVWSGWMWQLVTMVALKNCWQGSIGCQLILWFVGWFVLKTVAPVDWLAGLMVRSSEELDVAVVWEGICRQWWRVLAGWCELLSSLCCVLIQFLHWWDLSGIRPSATHSIWEIFFVFV